MSSGVSHTDGLHRLLVEQVRLREASRCVRSRLWGGGLTGLVASIVAAENGASVHLFETQRRLGGRARSTKLPYVANFGGHVIYGDGPWWLWLRERRILPPHASYPMGGLRFHINGKLHVTLPSEAFTVLFKLRGKAPADRAFRSWAEAKVGHRPLRSSFPSAAGQSSPSLAATPRALRTACVRGSNGATLPTIRRERTAQQLDEADERRRKRAGTGAHSRAQRAAS